jgi:hypothetical protein
MSASLFMAMMLRSILLFVKACWYTVMHPFDVIYFTVVRRYADAQGNYISELYEGNGRDAKMIGASCDNWPLDADMKPLPTHPQLCWSKSFLDPLPRNTLRVGAMEPQDNARTQEYISIRRFCVIRIMVLNRFVEYVLDKRPIL